MNNTLAYSAHSQATRKTNCCEYDTIVVNYALSNKLVFALLSKITTSALQLREMLGVPNKSRVGSMACLQILHSVEGV